MNKADFFWKTVRELAGSLPDAVHITTLSDSLLEQAGEWQSGVTCEASKLLAAERIIQRTHRLATPAEIEQMHKDQDRRAAECAAVEAARSRSSSLTLSAAFQEAVKRLGPNPEK